MFREKDIAAMVHLVRNAHPAGDAHFSRVVATAVRQRRLLNRWTFQPVMLRLTRGGDWCAALALLRHPDVMSDRQILRSDALWNDIVAALPSNESREASAALLKQVFSASVMHSVGRQPSRLPSKPTHSPPKNISGVSEKRE